MRRRISRTSSIIYPRYSPYVARHCALPPLSSSRRDREMRGVAERRSALRCSARCRLVARQTFTSLPSAITPSAGSSRRGRRARSSALTRARYAIARRELPARRHGGTRGVRFDVRADDGDTHTLTHTHHPGKTSSDRRRRTRTARTAETRMARLAGDGRRCATTCNDDARTEPLVADCRRRLNRRTDGRAGGRADGWVGGQGAHWTIS